MKFNSFIEKYAPFLIVVGLFIIAEFFIKPTGEFPLNDDWEYSKTIKYYLESGKLKIPDMVAIPFVPLFTLGTIACKIFGFSFFVLRLISILLTVGSLFYFNQIISKFSLSSINKFPLLLLFIFNPLVFSLGNSFMPDTMSLFLAIASVYYMLEYMNSKKLIHFILFCFCAVLGTINRQTGLILPLIFFLIYLYYDKKTYKTILICLIPFSISFFSLMVYEYFVRSNGLLTENYNRQLQSFTTIEGLKSLNFLLILCYFLTSISTLGLFIFPLIISNIKTYLFDIFFSKIKLMFFCFFLILFFYKSFFTIWYMPFVGNMFYPIGTGPMIFDGFNSDQLILTNYNINFSYRIIYIIFSFIGGISFFFACTTMLRKLKNNIFDQSYVVVLTFILLFTIYLGLVTLNYPNDRYLMLLVPFFLIAYIVSINFKFKKHLFRFTFVFILFFTLSTTFDYFRIHDARWKGIHHLKDDLKVLNEKIDGGLEFNAFYLEGRNNYKRNDNYHWVVDDEYIISALNHKKNYTVESEYPFYSINSFPFNKIYILKRD